MLLLFFCCFFFKSQTNTLSLFLSAFLLICCIHCLNCATLQQYPSMGSHRLDITDLPFPIYECGMGLRIIESSQVEKAYKIIKSSHQFDLLSPITGPCPSVPHSQDSWISEGWGLHCCPGQPVSLLYQPLHEEIFHYVQFKLPLVELEIISLHPFTLPRWMTLIVQNKRAA